MVGLALSSSLSIFPLFGVVSYGRSEVMLDERHRKL